MDEDELQETEGPATEKYVPDISQFGVVLTTRP